MMKLLCLFLAVAGFGLAAAKLADPTPGEPLTVTMGQRTPTKIRVARGQATLIRLPEGQRVMSTYGGDKGEGGLDLVLPSHEEAVHEVHTGCFDGHRHLAGTGFGVRELLHPQDGGRAQHIADGGTHGAKR